MGAYCPKKSQATYSPKMTHPGGANDSPKNDGSIAPPDGEIGSRNALCEEERFVISSPFCYPHRIEPLAPPTGALSMAEIAP